MKSIFHPHDSRGKGEYGWLSTRYSFSFADWYDETKMGFGALRVLNDDVIAGGYGFGMHAHRDMEIITIVTEGSVRHEDSMGNSYLVSTGDVQVMSAGTGVKHSEVNGSQTDTLKLFQIWIEPKAKNLAPRYDQKSFSFTSQDNALVQVVGENALKINQEASIYLGALHAYKTTTYSLPSNHGAYIFVISGELRFDDLILTGRDAYGIWDTDQITITAEKDARFLLIDVPL